MSIRPLASLTAGDLRRVSWLYLAVPPRTTPDVLELLAKLSVNDINLIIDTPVLLWRQRGAKKHFNKFKRVVVAEDIIHLPWIDTVKEMIGHKITEMIFNQSAYRYHGIALIKELWAVKTFKSVRLTRDKHTSIVLKNNFNHLARIVEPKDYNVGQMTFVGP